MAGTLIVEKIVGAAAEQGATLADCKALGDRVNAATASMGVAFTSCTVPAAGRPTFDIGPDEIEIGVGIHGEPGRRRAAHMPANEIVRTLMDAILGDLKPEPGRKVLLHVNGFGGTPLMELYLLHHAGGAALEGRRPDADSLAGRQLHHLARHGRRFIDRDAARRRTRCRCGMRPCMRRRCDGEEVAGEPRQ